jgi:hypothetical protein
LVSYGYQSFADLQVGCGRIVDVGIVFPCHRTRAEAILSLREPRLNYRVRIFTNKMGFFPYSVGKTNPSSISSTDRAAPDGILLLLYDGLPDAAMEFPDIERYVCNRAEWLLRDTGSNRMDCLQSSIHGNDDSAYVD